MTDDARLARDVSRKLVYELFRYIIPVPVRGRGRRPTCGRVLVGGVGLLVAGFWANASEPLGRGRPPTDCDVARLGGRGNSESGSLALAILLRSTGLSVDMDMDRTGAMTDVDRERGGTIRDTAGAAVARAGPEG